MQLSVMAWPHPKALTSSLHQHDWPSNLYATATEKLFVANHQRNLFHSHEPVTKQCAVQRAITDGVREPILHPTLLVSRDCQVHNQDTLCALHMFCRLKSLRQNSLRCPDKKYPGQGLDMLP